MTIRLHSDLSDTISENSRVAAATRRRGTDRDDDDDDDDDVFERGFRVDCGRCGRREGGRKEEERRKTTEYKRELRAQKYKLSPRTLPPLDHLGF